MFKAKIEAINKKITILEAAISDLELDHKTPLQRIKTAQKACQEMLKDCGNVDQKNLGSDSKVAIKTRYQLVCRQLKVVDKSIQESKKSQADKAKITANISEILALIDSFDKDLFSIDVDSKVPQRNKYVEEAKKLWQCQQTIAKDDALKNKLAKIKELSLDLDNPFTPPCVYFCYATPHEKFKSDEAWVQAFLKTLKIHLEDVGIEDTYLDCVDLKLGYNNFQFVEKLKDTDYVLVIGTESLKEKHNQGVDPLLTAALNQLIDKRKSDQQDGYHRILPIILSGNEDVSFPTEYKRYAIPDWDWTQKKYIDNLKTLIERLYEIGKDHKEFYAIWRDDEKATDERIVQPSPLSVAVSAVAAKSTDPAKTDKKKELDVKEALFGNEKLNPLLVRPNNKAKGIKAGTSDFKKLITDGNNFVDKTLFIKSVLQAPFEVDLIVRPRRFGKTSNMSMLSYFFNIKNKAENLFERRKIFTTKYVWEAVKDHYHQYPVISITLKNITGVDFISASNSFRDLISKIYREHKEELYKNLEESERKLYLEITDGKASPANTKDALQFLTKYLKNAYKKNVIVLIDEYDAPLYLSYRNNYHKEMEKFLNEVLTSLLKDNEFLQWAILTGIMRISGNSVFSGLNNINMYSVLDDKYAEDFGFKSEEVEELFTEISEPPSLEAIEDWYGGYRIGQHVTVCNPWSVCNFYNDFCQGRVKENTMREYWLASAAGDSKIENLLKTKVQNTVSSNESFKMFLKVFLENKSQSYDVGAHIVFNAIEENESTLWSFMLLAGYLTLSAAEIYNPSNRSVNVQLTIPNKELYDFYIKLATDNKWFSKDEKFRFENNNAIYRKDREAKKQKDEKQREAQITEFKNDLGKALGLAKLFPVRDLLALGIKDELVISTILESIKSHDKSVAERADNLVYEYKLQVFLASAYHANLSHPDSGRRRLAFTMLREISTDQKKSDEFKKVILKNLGVNEKAVRQDNMVFLGEMKEEKCHEAIDTYIGNLTSINGIVRIEAIKLLLVNHNLSLIEQKVIDALVGNIAQLDKEIQVGTLALIEELTKLNDKEIVKAYLSNLQSNNSNLRESAKDILEKMIFNQFIQDNLLAYLNHSESVVRFQAEQLLIHFDKIEEITKIRKKQLADSKGDAEILQEAAEYLYKHLSRDSVNDEALCSVLRRNLAARKVNIRQQAKQLLENLSKLNVEETYQQFGINLNNDNPDVQLEAINFLMVEPRLTRFKAKIIEALKSILRVETLPRERIAVLIKELNLQLSPEIEKTYVEKLTKHRNPQMRQEAAEFLLGRDEKKYQETAAAILIQNTKADVPVTVRGRAAQFILEYKMFERYSDRLEKIYTENLGNPQTKIRLEAIDALFRKLNIPNKNIDKTKGILVSIIKDDGDVSNVLSAIQLLQLPNVIKDEDRKQIVGSLLRFEREASLDNLKTLIPVLVNYGKDEKEVDAILCRRMHDDNSDIRLITIEHASNIAKPSEDLRRNLEKTKLSKIIIEASAAKEALNKINSRNREDKFDSSDKTVSSITDNAKNQSVTKNNIEAVDDVVDMKLVSAQANINLQTIPALLFENPRQVFQCGWNCFDLAVGLDTVLNIDEKDAKTRAHATRDKLVAFALDQKNISEFRRLLAPEIRHAAGLTAVYLNLQKDKENSDKERNTRLAELFGVAEALAKARINEASTQAEISQQIVKLLAEDDHSKQDVDVIGLDRHTLPVSLQTEALRKLMNDYQGADETMQKELRALCAQYPEMQAAVDACKQALSQEQRNREINIVAAEDLYVFLKMPEQQKRYPLAWEVYSKQYHEKFVPHEKALQTYCEDEKTYSTYVKDYYGKQQGWVAFQRSFKGEGANTSMVDIAARLLNAQIVVCQKDPKTSNVWEEIYCTASAVTQNGKKMYVQFNGRDHFVALQPILSSNVPSPQNQSDDKSALSIAVASPPVISIDFKALENQATLIDEEALQQKVKAFIVAAEKKIKRIPKALLITNSQNVVYTAVEELEKVIREMRTVKINDNTDSAAVHTIITAIENPYKLLRAQIGNQLLVKDDISAAELNWKIFALPCQQQLLVSDATRKKDFDGCLQQLKGLIQQRKGTAATNLFISYAWPTPQYHSKEYWLQPFLKQLREHLRQAGIHAILDIVDNKPGGDIIQFMEQAKDANFVLVIFTESLKDKHLKGHGLKAVNTELNNISHKRKIDYELGLTRVLPFLVTGTHATSYPANYELYSTVRDWRGANYLEIIKTIITQLHAIELQDEQFNGIWNAFIQKYSTFTLSVPKAQVEKFRTQQDYKKELDELTVEEGYKTLLREVGQYSYLPANLPQVLADAKHKITPPNLPITQTATSPVAALQSITLALGSSDYKSAVMQGGLLVDKTLFIKELIDDKTQVKLIIRPRRFGKTLNMSMLRYFFEKTDKTNEHAGLFFDRAIWKAGKQYQDEQGRYPVLFITMKDVKAKKYEEAEESIRELLSTLYKQYKELLFNGVFKNDADEQKDYQTIIDCKGSITQTKNALKKLTGYLQKASGKQVIVLIDEYDTPFNASYEYHYYPLMADFMRGILSPLLKDNLHLYQAVLTGILCFAKESIFSGLNNARVYSALSDSYATQFGFSANEVKDLLKNTTIPSHLVETIEDWYGGYQMGSQKLFNPWSITNFIEDNRRVLPEDIQYRSYWLNTSENKLVSELLVKSDDLTKKIFKDLLANKPTIQEISEHTVFADITKNPQTLWSFLFLCGYLTVKPGTKKLGEEKTLGEFVVVNKELYGFYETLTKPWLIEENPAVASLREHLVISLATNFTRLKSSVLSLNLSNRKIQTALLQSIAIAETANNKIHPFSDKKVIEAHCDNIKNQLSVVLKNIQDSEKPLADKAGINAIIEFLQAEIRSIYLTFFPEKGWVIKPEERAKLLQQAQALYKSQQETMKDAHFNQCLEQVQSRALDATNPYSSPKVYFCYAWPHDKYKAEEQWVQDFLKTLKNHLASAGIENTLLDVADNRHGDNIYHFMDQLDDSDYVIVFGTESLLEKHNRGTSALTTELIKLIQKRTKEQEQGLHRVLPILLSGNHQISFPSNYTMYMTIRDWPAKDYVNNFKMLVERLYEVGKNDVDFHKIWQIDAKATNVSSVQLANLTAATPGSYPGFFQQAGAPAVVHGVKTVDNDNESQTPNVTKAADSGIGHALTGSKDSKQTDTKAKNSDEKNRSMDNSVMSRDVPGIEGICGEVNVTGDGSCLPYSVTFSYLLPVLNDYPRFSECCIQLFGKQNIREDAIKDLNRLLIQYRGEPNFIKEHASQLEVLVDRSFRNNFIQYMADHKTDFSESIPGDFVAYLKKQATPKEWCGEQEIKAISAMLKVRIVIYDPPSLGGHFTAPKQTHGENFRGTIYLVHADRGTHYHYLIPLKLLRRMPQASAADDKDTVVIDKKIGPPENKKSNHAQPIASATIPLDKKDEAKQTSHLASGFVIDSLIKLKEAIQTKPSKITIYADSLRKEDIDEFFRNLFPITQCIIHAENFSLSTHRAGIIKLIKNGLIELIFHVTNLQDCMNFIENIKFYSSLKKLEFKFTNNKENFQWQSDPFTITPEKIKGKADEIVELNKKLKVFLEVELPEHQKKMAELNISADDKQIPVQKAQVEYLMGLGENFNLYTEYRSFYREKLNYPVFEIIDKLASSWNIPRIVGVGAIDKLKAITSFFPHTDLNQRVHLIRGISYRLIDHAVTSKSDLVTRWLLERGTDITREYTKKGMPIFFIGTDRDSPNFPFDQVWPDESNPLSAILLKHEPALYDALAWYLCENRINDVRRILATTKVDIHKLIPAGTFKNFTLFQLVIYYKRTSLCLDLLKNVTDEEKTNIANSLYPLFLNPSNEEFPYSAWSVISVVIHQGQYNELVTLGPSKHARLQNFHLKEINAHKDDKQSKINNSYSAGYKQQIAFVRLLLSGAISPAADLASFKRCLKHCIDQKIIDLSLIKDVVIYHEELAINLPLLHFVIENNIYSIIEEYIDFFAGKLTEKVHIEAYEEALNPLQLAVFSSTYEVAIIKSLYKTYQKYNYLDVVREPLPNYAKMNLFQFAVIYKDENILPPFIDDKNCPINAPFPADHKEYPGWLPIHIAILNNFYMQGSVVNLLLKRMDLNLLEPFPQGGNFLHELEGLYPLSAIFYSGEPRRNYHLSRAGGRIISGYYEEFLPLIMKSAISNEKKVEIYTQALWMAVKHQGPQYNYLDHTKQIESLVKLGADFNYAVGNGYRIVDYARDEKGLSASLFPTASIHSSKNEQLSKITDNVVTQELLIAVRNNDAKEVERLSNMGADVNAMIEEKDEKVQITYPAPLLLYSIMAHRLPIVDVLLRNKKIDISKSNPRGFSPLLAAAREGFYDLVVQLIQMKADVGQTNNTGLDAFDFAVEQGHLSIVEYLHQRTKNRDIDNDKNSTTDTPLATACNQQRFEVAKYLVKEANADVNKGRRNTNYSPLMFAAQQRSFELVALLLEHKAEVNHVSKEGWTALMLACGEKYHLLTVERLLLAGATVNAVTIVDRIKGKGGETALHSACSYADVPIVDTLLKAGARVNALTANGRTPLYFAAANNKPLIIKRLMEEKDLDCNLTSGDTRWMMSPLNLASFKGHVEVVKLLLTIRGINVNQNDVYNDYPLIGAVISNHVDVVKLLLNVPGINVNCSQQNGDTSLSISRASGFKEIETLLLAHPDINDPDQNLPLIGAARKGDVARIRELVQFNKDINKTTENGETALYVACYNNQLAVVTYLLNQDNIDVNLGNKSGLFPLYIAAMKGHALIVKALSTHPQIKINQRRYGSDGGATSLFIAAVNRCLEVVKILLEAKNINVNQARIHQGNDGRNPLIAAAEITKTDSADDVAKATEIGCLLIKYPEIDVNIQSADMNRSMSPLLNAATNGNEKLIKALLDHPKININIQTTGGYTALAQAASNNHLSSVQLLLKAPGINVNLPTKRNLTPLTCAVANGHEEAARLLLDDKRINLEVEDDKKKTALFYAASKGFLPIVQLLVKYGVNVFHTSDEGLTSLHVALQNGHISVAKFLKETEDQIAQQQEKAKQQKLESVAAIQSPTTSQLKLQQPNVEKPTLDLGENQFFSPAVGVPPVGTIASASDAITADKDSKMPMLAAQVPQNKR